MSRIVVKGLEEFPEDADCFNKIDIYIGSFVAPVIFSFTHNTNKAPFTFKKLMPVVILLQYEGSKM
jgi:hypothetical protein